MFRFKKKKKTMIKKIVQIGKMLMMKLKKNLKYN